MKSFLYKDNPTQQLKGFCYTVQTGSMSEAARRLGLTQSAISHQIKSLERDLGINLFKRNKNKISLTKEGELFYENSISCLNEIESLFGNFNKKLKKQQNITINIGSNQVSTCYILPKYLRLLKDSNPNIKIKVKNLTKAQCVEKLLNAELDLFIYPKLPGENFPELTFTNVITHKTILILHKDHPLAKKKKISLADLKGYDHLRIDPKFSTVPRFNDTLKAYNLTSSIELEMSDWQILKKFVKANLGITIVSDIIMKNDPDPDIASIDLSNHFPNMEYGIYLKKGKKNTGALKEFIELLTTK